MSSGDSPSTPDITYSYGYAGGQLLLGADAQIPSEFANVPKCPVVNGELNAISIRQITGFLLGRWERL